MMKDRDSSNPPVHRRPTPRRGKSLFLILFCCLAAATSAIVLFSNNFFLSTDMPPAISLFSGSDFNHTANTSPTADARSSDEEEPWYLILVNKWNYIPDDYDLELIKLTNGQSVDKRIYPALQEMVDTARSQGVYPVVVSGYRTAEEQQSLLNDKLAEYKAEGYSDGQAKTKAEAWVAIPGTSEHQIGIAVDINADDEYSADYEVYQWLDQNAYKFGFICRYPADKTEITGVINEPWHYRYVGTEAAAIIQSQGVCLEEYLAGIN